MFHTKKYQYLLEFHAQIHSWKIITKSNYWHTKVKKKKSIHFFFKTINSNFVFLWISFTISNLGNPKRNIWIFNLTYGIIIISVWFSHVDKGFPGFFVHSLKPKHWIHAVELEISSYSDQVVEYVLVFALSWAKKWHLTGTLRDNRVTCASTCMK